MCDTFRETHLCLLAYPFPRSVTPMPQYQEVCQALYSAGHLQCTLFQDLFRLLKGRHHSTKEMRGLRKVEVPGSRGRKELVFSKMWEGHYDLCPCGMSYILTHLERAQTISASACYILSLLGNECLKENEAHDLEELTKKAPEKTLRPTKGERLSRENGSTYTNCTSSALQGPALEDDPSCRGFDCTVFQI